MSRPSVPPATLETFLDALSAGATSERTCAAAHTSRSTAYGYRRRDPDFAGRWDETLRQGLDALEDELHARAMDRAPPTVAALLAEVLSHQPA